MKYAVCAFFSLLALFFLVSAALSQDPMMILDHKELGPHQRPLVHFDHEQHSNKIECQHCHHDYDQYGNNRGGEGRPCADCHNPGAGKTTLGLKDAFHAQCKSCHLNAREAGRPSGPIMCGECHKRR
jgi:hypothetical protein